MYNYNLGYPQNYIPPINFGFNPLQAEKQRTKKIGNAIGITLIVLIASSTVLGTVVGFILSALGTAAGNSGLYTGDGNILNVASSVISVIIMTIPFIICIKCLNMDVGSTVSTGRVNLGIIVPLVMIGFGFNAVANCLNNIFSSSISYFGITPSMSNMNYGSGFTGFAISMLCIAAFPALVEEFAFRGVILGILKKRFNPKVAIIGSAIVFGLVHGNLVQIPFAFLMGLVFGFMAVYSKSIWPSVIAHFLNNGISVILDFTASKSSPLVQSVIWCAYGIICGVLALVGLIILHKRDENILKFDTFDSDDSVDTIDSAVSVVSDKNDSVSTVQRVKWLVTSIGMVIFGVLIVAEIVVSQLFY